MSGPTVGELFAGYGGLGLAVKELWPAATVRWVSDIEEGPKRVLAQRFPDAPNLGDITAIDWANVEPVDIITGGSPCQDLSHAGKRAGMRDGTRSGLWASMCDAIEALRPGMVIWENVRGAYSAEADSGVEPCPLCVGEAGSSEPVLRALGRVLGDLSEIGYDAIWTGLRAADVGACHGRFRVFVIAWPADSASVGHEWARGARHGRDGSADSGRGPVALPTPRATRGGSTTETVGLLPTPRASDDTHAGPNQRGSKGDLTVASAVASLLPTPAVNDMGAGKDVDAWDAWTDAMQTKHGNGNGHGKSLEIEAQRLLPSPQTSDTNGAGDKPGEWADRWQLRDIVMDKVRAVWGDYAPAITRAAQALGRPAPAPTLPSGRDGKAQLSPIFEEWMMMLPEGWVTDPAIWADMKPSAARNAQVRLMGNGVVPAQAAEAIRWCLNVRALECAA